jgi:hypothetical protein
VARYVYEGTAPEADGDGGLVRPLDVREFDADPGWGAWRRLGDGDPQNAPEPLQAVPALPPAPPPAADMPATGTEG